MPRCVMAVICPKDATAGEYHRNEAMASTCGAHRATERIEQSVNSSGATAKLGMKKISHDRA